MDRLSPPKKDDIFFFFFIHEEWDQRASHFVSRRWLWLLNTDNTGREGYDDDVRRDARTEVEGFNAGLPCDLLKGEKLNLTNLLY